MNSDDNPFSRTENTGDAPPQSTKSQSQSTDDSKPFSGYRLSRLEVFNWGIFDGSVFVLPLSGQTTLLVGENGSGKSTLVDALLTLLVRPQGRNYNVAAGANKNERDERSYIRGAHDRTVGPDGRPQVQYLRSGVGQYSVLLATFENVRQQSSFTLCQVLYLNSESGVERIYAYCDGARSIVSDLSQLTSGATLNRQLRERGFETTTSYTQYFHWWQRKLHLRSKAMDIFNQTVAVKDVHRLDMFIRQHMLERQPWSDRVAKLLAHFHELSEAHAMLIKARRQEELLRPVVEAGSRYLQRSTELQAAQEQLAAMPVYYARARSQLLEPCCTQWQQQIAFCSDQIQRLDVKLENLRTDIARLEVEIESSGGDRLKLLPSLIQQELQLAETKRDSRRRFEANLHTSGIAIEVTSPDQFHKVRRHLATRQDALTTQRDRHRGQSNDLQYQIGKLKSQQADEQQELRSLESRRGNLPQAQIDLRDALCRQLKLASSDLPFVAELLEVKSQHRGWQASIEQVLHGFARSLLVTERFYARVSGYIDSTALRDQRGQGQRLVYLRVANRDGDQDVHDPIGLAGMLDYRQHDLIGWVKAELLQRFDFRACETIQEFQAADAKAMTRNRHIRTHTARHEKDDRQLENQRKHFVLGWDNREKQSLLRESLRTVLESLEQLAVRDATLVSAIDRDTRAIEALQQVASVTDFDQIDADRHEFQASQLRLEKTKLEESNDVIRDFRTKVAGLRAEVVGYQQDRDQLLQQKTRLETELSHGQRLLINSQQLVTQAQQSGTWAVVEKWFEALQERFSTPLSLDNMGQLPESMERQQRAKVETFIRRLEPLQKEVTLGMTRFLRGFPEEYADLDADIASIVSFTALYDRIAGDDLPRHEERFKQRLNEKVLHEVGLLRSSLENDRQEIRDKIEQLNGALRRLEWKPGSYMSLEATDVTDREIQDFHRDLAGCLTGTLDGTAEANEATFIRIEKLVGRLRDAGNERWRDKVVDVRNWFNFAAREVVAGTGQSRSYYDGGAGQSGGEKGKLAFLVLVAAIAYQYDLDPDADNDQRFHFVMVDEMFSRSDDQHAEYAMELFEQFGLQLLIVAPLDAKVRVTEPYVGTYVQVIKDRQTHRSSILTITADKLRQEIDVL